MSTPFIEMPQRAEASPRIDDAARRGRWRRPTGWRSPSTTTVPDMMFSATPTPALPCTRTVALLVHAGAVVAGVALDLDLDRRVDARGERVRAARVEHAPAARPVVAAACSAAFSSRSGVDRQVDLLASSRSTRTSDRPLPAVDARRARAPRSSRPRRRAARRSRGTRTPSPPSRRSRPSPPACRRSGRAAPRSRRPCRPRTCRSRRGPRGSPRAPAPAWRPRAAARSGSRPRPRSRCRSGTRCPRGAAAGAGRLWFESEPLWTRQRSSPVENGCECSVVTRLSVAMRVWPSAWLPCISSSPKRLDELARRRPPPCRSRSSGRRSSRAAAGSARAARPGPSRRRPRRRSRAWLAAHLAARPRRTRSASASRRRAQSCSRSGEKSDTLDEPDGAGSR